MKAGRRIGARATFAPALALALLATTLTATAQDEARLPRPRPPSPAEAAEAAVPQDVPPAEEGDAGNPAEALEAPDAGSAIDLFARVPRSRPEAPPALALIAPDDIVPQPEAPLGPRVPSESEAQYTAGLARIRALGVVFTEEAEIDPPGGCRVERPLNVASIGSGISVTPEAILNCGTAEALALWARDVVLPAAEKHLDSPPEQIVHGSAYVCRPRNNQAGARLSEHATGNAFDISSIRFEDGEAVDIGLSEKRGERLFEAAIREGSCDYFTTVLGPGSNAAHATHFHFDLAERRGGYRLCELGGATISGRTR
jgi:hypothetical protein